MSELDLLKCPHCGDTARIGTDKGWRRHMSSQHGGYTKEQLQTAGIEENAGDRIRYLSAGFQSLTEVRNAAPESEGEASATAQRGSGPVSARRPRLSKEEQQKASEQAEFDRLKPVLLAKWRRRLRIVYGTWARLAEDEKIRLTDDEADEGSEMHVELMQAFGWIRAGKIEAVVDLCMWHGAMILSRSDAGQALLNSFKGQQPENDTVQ
jgi:hypothetical protein